ncbi:MAG: hypothetical protein ACE5MK_01705 [Acidobacteriota bacterium]
MAYYFVPYVVHESNPTKCFPDDPTPNTLYPQFDTLFYFANRNTYDISVNIQVFDDQGNPKSWSDGPTHVIDIPAGQSNGTTLIPGHSDPSPPTDFVGYTKISTVGPSPFHGANVYGFFLIGGKGCPNDHWNIFSAFVPFNYGSLPAPRSAWVLPLAVPKWDTPDGKAVGLAITNFSTTDQTFTIRFVRQGSADPNEFVSSKLIAGGESYHPQLTDLFDFSAYTQVKGHVEVTTSPAIQAAVYEIQSNPGYKYFSSGLAAFSGSSTIFHSCYVVNKTIAGVAYDTVIGIYNPNASSITVTEKLVDGATGGETTRSIAIDAQRTVIYTLSGNFVGPPPGLAGITNFEGFATYESSSVFMLSAIVGVSDWDGTSTAGQFFGANVPAVADSQLTTQVPRLGYTIPFFTNDDHPDAEGLGYRTRIVVSNFDTVSSTFTFEYMPNPNYSGFPNPPYTFTKTVGARRQVVFDLQTELDSQDPDYPPSKNNEGWLKASTNPGVRALVHAFITSTNADKFAAGQIQNNINPLV